MNSKIYKMIHISAILLMMILITVPVAAGISKVGTTSAQFLKIGVGARSMGMGGAGVASVNDASALYWNPAVIAGFRSTKVLAAYTDWFLDTEVAFTGLAMPLGKFGALGFTFNSLSMGKMDVRTVERPDGTGEQFTAGDLAVGIAYAKQLTNFFSIGFHGKYVSQNIWHCKAASFAIDFGSHYRTDDNRLMIGASISNFGDKVQYTGKDLRIYHDQNPDEFGDNEYLPAYYETSSWDLPLIFRIGVALNLPEFPLGDLVAEIDAIHPNDNNEQVNLGLEWGLNRMLFLRTGYQALFQQNAEQGLTFGAGLRYKLLNSYLNVNYGYADFGRLQAVQRIDIEIEF